MNKLWIDERIIEINHQLHPIYNQTWNIHSVEFVETKSHADFYPCIFTLNYSAGVINGQICLCQAVDCFGTWAVVCFTAVHLVTLVHCGCEAHFRCWLPGWDHQCFYSVSAAGGFLPSTEDVLGHAAGWRRREPGEEPARIRCEAYFNLPSVNHDSVKYKLYYPCWSVIFLSCIASTFQWRFG